MKQRRVALTREERALLLQACRRYKNNLPIYLESVRSELKIIKALLRKLGESAPGELLFRLTPRGGGAGGSLLHGRGASPARPSGSGGWDGTPRPHPLSAVGASPGPEPPQPPGPGLSRHGRSTPAAFLRTARR